MLSAVSDDVPGVTEREIAQWAAEASRRQVYDTAGGPGMIGGMLSENLRRLADPAERDVAAPAHVAANAGEQPLGYGYPAPFTRYETFPAYTNYPHQTVGKVFFTKPGIGRFVCSAASIGGDGVLTAAHCVQDGRTGTWWSNWVFVPAYKNGQAPFGQWTTDHLWVMGGWADGGDGDFRYDVGGAVLDRRSGKKISQQVGFLGFLWNASSNAHWTVLGYPQGAPFNGRLQYICQASHAYNSGGGYPDPFAVGCDLTGGSSGGPWLRGYSKSPGNTNFVNGVNSFRRCTDAGCNGTLTQEMFSPYFDNSVKFLRDCIVSSVPGNPADPGRNCAPGT